jgi:hypothetical protein
MNKIVNRGGMLVKLSAEIKTDLLWLSSDIGRAKTLEARWKAMGVSNDECRKLIPCAIWLAKFPGTQYSDTIMTRLAELRCTD